MSVSKTRGNPGEVGDTLGNTENMDMFAYCNYVIILSKTIYDLFTHTFIGCFIGPGASVP